MSDKADQEIERSMRKLSDIIREVKSETADRDDVVVELREAQTMRLELLVQELEPVLADIPREDDWFDLALSSGVQPRFWIDATSHVTMGRDKRTYRFLRDTRLGRQVLAESGDVKAVAEQVGRYIAERMVERERMQAGSVTAVDRGAPVPSTLANVDGAQRRPGGFLEGLMIFIIGALAGAALLVALAWDKLEALGINLDFLK